jgi:hypothetical protein
VTTCVLVMVAPESDDAWPPHPWFLLGNSSHESNERLRVIPLLLVRDGSNVTRGADFCGLGPGYRHMRLRTVPCRHLTGRKSAAGDPPASSRMLNANVTGFPHAHDPMTSFDNVRARQQHFLGRRRRASQILGLQAGPFGNAGQHPRPDLVGIMKREHVIRPVSAYQGLVRA